MRRFGDEGLRTVDELQFSLDVLFGFDDNRDTSLSVAFLRALRLGSFLFLLDLVVNLLDVFFLRVNGYHGESADHDEGCTAVY